MGFTVNIQEFDCVRKIVRLLVVVFNVLVFEFSLSGLEVIRYMIG